MEFKKYNHLKEEKIISDYWIKGNYFKPKKTKLNKKFSVVIPPPNVTGRLHMGHALNNSLQDVLVRFKRMNGFETLWQPGTDHAGIATQAVVEKNLEKEKVYFSAKNFITDFGPAETQSCDPKEERICFILLSEKEPTHTRDIEFVV